VIRRLPVAALVEQVQDVIGTGSGPEPDVVLPQLERSTAEDPVAEPVRGRPRLGRPVVQVREVSIECRILDFDLDRDVEEIEGQREMFDAVAPAAFMLIPLIEKDVTTGTVNALAATSRFRNVRRLASTCSNPSPS
jgi:hypothetical protein